ncbi:MAG: PTS sugar transporter subunit IIA [Verrucomicrobia bacterium]|nr:PTS sugar transporter subunit IIA [Verrucomicrobiota bacterium]MCG2681720.1 PTS sugar transporter subunit IIA [Kiritimatiellia bacterium]MBU4247181.1 PTS sugar transporter subunit IIA [Verrucomicrobiota bacterium]MBU4291400.1 PTS sugar transporter subunit IIA [Verrucomicrobiota bacterium]MBU4428568.1 PTS sugar transporter subunit IIA [Verrucomicrobiota bacterium]
MPYRTYNLTEVCNYLHLAQPDVELLVRRQEIPFDKKGGRLIFRKKDIDAWASQRILSLSNKRLTAYHQVSSAKIHDLSKRHAIIAELVKQEYIRPALCSRTKPSLLRDMVALAKQTSLVMSPDDLLNSLLERERLCSTALPEGIALLHPRHHEPYMFEDSFIVLGRTVHPLPFGAPDGNTTDLFFLICCQDDRIHLHVLARICMMCRDTKVLQEIRAAPDAAAIFDGLVRSENETIKRI